MNSNLKLSRSARAGILAAAFFLAARSGASAQTAPGPAVDPAAPAETNSAPLRFRVLDSVTAAPLPGVKVRGWGKTFVTDSNGSCSFARPKPPTNDFAYDFFIIPKGGYVDKSVTWAASRHDNFEDIPAEYTVKLDKAASIGGVLKDPDGQPLDGAVLRFSGVNPAAPFDRERTLAAPNFRTERTDENGRWQCNHLPQDFSNLVIRVIKPDFLPVTFGCEGSSTGGSDVVRLPAADFLAGKAVMVLGRGITVSGQIVDSRGKPVANVVITRNHQWRNPSSVLQSDDSGRFIIPNLLPGDLTFTLQAKGLEPQTLDLAITNPMPELKVAMKPGQILKGRVLDETGQPVAGASVQLDRVELEPLEFDWSATTDSNGRFQWDSAPFRPAPLFDHRRWLQSPHRAGAAGG